MDPSFTELRSIRCEACGDSYGKRLWVCVDLKYRPEFRRAMSSPEPFGEECPSCGSFEERPHPLLVLRLSRDAPVVFSVPSDWLEEENLEARAQDLLPKAYARLGNESAEVPGPFLIAPFWVVSIASQRDVSADLDDAPGGAAFSDLNQEEADVYRVFLGHVRGSSGQRAAFRAISQFQRASTRKELLRVREKRGEALLSTEAEAALLEQQRQARGDDAAIAALDAQVGALASLRAGDVDRAWELFESGGVAAAEILGGRLSDLFALLEQAMDPDAIERVGDELLALAEASPALEVQVEAVARVAQRRLTQIWTTSPQYARQTISYLERAIELTEELADPSMEEGRIWLIHNLAVALAGRGGTDPVADQERAVALLREVRDHARQHGRENLQAFAQNNLGKTLTERALLARGAVGIGEDPAESEEAAGLLAEARGHLEDALKHRTFERNPIDWAHTKLNLGATLTKVTPRTVDLTLEALGHYDEVFARLERGAGGDELRALAVHNASDALSYLAHSTPAGEQRGELLHRAKESAFEAVALTAESGSALQGATAHRRLAEVLAEVDGYTDQTRDAYRRASSDLFDHAAYRECRDVARAFAALAAENGDWPQAAEAWKLTAQAARAAIDLRREPRGKLAEVRESMNIFRYGAYALARVGRLEEAVDVLERGRARFLTDWLSQTGYDRDLLEGQAPATALRLENAIRGVRRVEALLRSGAPNPGDPINVHGELRAAIDEAREVPGLERLWSDPSASKLIAGMPDGEAVVYLVTSPEGSAILLLSRSGVRKVELGFSSTEAFPYFFDPATGDGYLAAVTLGVGDLDTAILRLESFLGERLMQPVFDALHELGARAACLVPLGILGFAPLHALHWDTPSGPRCLLDDFSVLVAPSAHARAVAREAASTASHARGGSAVIGNPLPSSDPLASAAAEAELVARLLPGQVTLLTGEEATKANVLASIQSQELLHFACHGESVPTAESLDSALLLADDEPLTAAELLDLDGFRPRLVVASACQTAVITNYDEADESLSLSTVMLGAGAVGVIASLWAVPDLATKVLMTRFWELVTGEQLSPGEALRQAQLWLRDVGAGEFAQYVNARSELREIAGSSPTRGGTASSRHPLSSWAAFVLSGA